MMIKTILFSFLLIFIPLTDNQAQSYEIEDVSIKNFKGVFELKDFGYAACFRKDGQWLLEILDQNLVKKTTTVIKFKIKEETSISGYSNGRTFLLTFSDTEKKHQIIGFEYSGKIIKTIDIEGKLGVIVPLKNKGYYLPINGKKKEKGRMIFLSNQMHESWNIEVPIPFPYRSIYSAGSSPETNVSPIFMSGFSEASNNAILWNHMEKKNAFSTKVVSNKIAAVSSEGKVLFDYNLDPKQDLLFMSKITESKVILIGGSGKLEEQEINEYWVKKLDMKGNVIEENEIDKNAFATENKKGFAISFFIKELIDTQNGYILAGANDSSFPIWYFDKEFNFIKRVDVDKTKDLYLGSGTYGPGDDLISSMFYQSYQFITSSKKGLYELIVYFVKKKKSVSVDVASTQENQSRSIKELDKEEKSSNLKISWIDVFPSRPGEGVLSFYQFKKKKITFIKIELED